MSIILVPILMLSLFVFSFAVLLISDESPFNKVKPVAKTWVTLKSDLNRRLADDEAELNRYNNSFRSKLSFLHPPRVNTLIRDELFNKTSPIPLPPQYREIPFQKLHDGSIALTAEMKEYIENKENWAIEESKNFVKTIAAYDAKYVILTGDDTFYQNHFVDEIFEQAYNESFIESLNSSLGLIAKKDVKKNRMNEKYLNSSLMRKPYQESYIMEKSAIQNSRKNLQDNYEALTAIQGDTNISAEDFKKVFGNEHTFILAEVESAQKQQGRF